MIDGKIIQDIAAEEVMRALEADESELGDAVQGIQAKIPESASAENQLATASDVSTLAAKVPDATLPVTAGSYKLVVTVDGETVSYSWVEIA